MSNDHLPAEKKVSGWTTKISDDREVFVGIDIANESDKTVYCYFENGEFKNFLKLSEDAAIALMASLESAMRYRRMTKELQAAAYRVKVSVEDQSKLPPGEWQLVTEGDANE